MKEAALPGDPAGWRDFRAALKKLIARSELTALAVERLSADPAVREAGAESITDSTISRKLADRDEPVDARSVRTIVTACAVATARRHTPTPDTDLSEWLRVRTLLAERATPAATAPAPPEPAERATPAAAPTPPGPAGRATPATAPAPPGPASGQPGRARPRRRWLITVAAVLVLAALATWPIMNRTTAGHEKPDPPPPCGEPADQPSTAGLSIATPSLGATLTGDSTPASGTVALAGDERPPWLLLLAKGDCKYYIEQPVDMSGSTWTSTVYADPTQKGTFAVYVVVVPPADDRRLHQLSTAGGSPSLPRLPPGSRAAHISVRCCA